MYFILGIITLCPPVIQILTLCPPIIITVYVLCTHLSLTITLTQKYVKTHSHPDQNTLIPKNHSLPSDLLTKNHLVSLPKVTHSHRSCKPSRGRQLLCLAVARRLTHSHRATRFTSLQVTRICMLEIVHANRAKEDQELLLLCSVVAGRLGFCFLIFEIQGSKLGFKIPSSKVSFKIGF